MLKKLLESLIAQSILILNALKALNGRLQKHKVYPKVLIAVQRCFDLDFISETKFDRLYERLFGRAKNSGFKSTSAISQLSPLLNQETSLKIVLIFIFRTTFSRLKQRK